MEKSKSLFIYLKTQASLEANKKPSFSCDLAPASPVQDQELCPNPTKKASLSEFTSHFPPPTQRTQESSKPVPKCFISSVFPISHENRQKPKTYLKKTKKEDFLFTPLLEYTLSCAQNF